MSELESLVPRVQPDAIATVNSMGQIMYIFPVVIDAEIKSISDKYGIVGVSTIDHRVAITTATTLKDYHDYDRRLKRNKS